MANRIMLNQTSYHGAGAISELPTEVNSAALKRHLSAAAPPFCVTELSPE